MAAVKFATQRVGARSASPVVRQLFETLRRRRIAIADAAAFMGMSSPGLAYWKSGRTTPRIDDIELLASLVGCEIVLKELPDAPP